MVKEDWYAHANKLVEWMRSNGVPALQFSTTEQGPVPGVTGISVAPIAPAQFGDEHVPRGNQEDSAERQERLREERMRRTLAASGGPRGGVPPWQSRDTG